MKKLKVTFVSNYINHHQIPFSLEMRKLLGDDYTFIQTEPMEEERVRMGWGLDTDTLTFVKLYYKEQELCDQLILESDVVIFGGTEREEIILPRLTTDKMTIRYSERLYKTGRWKAISPRGLIKKYKDHTQYRKKNVFLLCSGAYVAGDFRIVHAYPKKKMRWGYFPECLEYKDGFLEHQKGYDKENDVEQSGCDGKQSKPIPLLWAGRFIDWKHPEYALQLAKSLKEKKFQFHLTMVGGGEMEQELKKYQSENHLEDVVTFAGFLEPTKVREQMEQSQIYLFTSDNQEGWGAVLNESMNSGCGVVACQAIGAAPYLIQNGVNGFLYPNGRYEQFEKQVIQLLEDRELRRKMGKEAVKTIQTTWNARNAAKNLIHFIETGEFASQGPCSREN